MVPHESKYYSFGTIFVCLSHLFIFQIIVASKLKKDTKLKFITYMYLFNFLKIKDCNKILIGRKWRSNFCENKKKIVFCDEE